MLVSLPAGMHGHPLDESDLPVHDATSIGALIREHQTSLEFTRITQSPMQSPCAAAEMAYWIGEFEPEHYHAVEVIDRHNLQLFEHRLQQRSLYRPEKLSHAHPALIILGNALECGLASKARLQDMSLAVLQSPFPAKTVLRNLAYCMAERECHRVYHGVMVSVCGEGVLLAGDSGLGKSGIALELVSRGHALVADDAPLLHRPAGASRVFALSSPLLADLLDVCATGILNISKLFGADASMALMPVDLIIELVTEYQTTAEQRLQPFAACTSILGVDIPRLQIPIAHVTNPAVLVETIVRNHVIYKDGYDANARLVEQQQQLINKQTL